MFVEGFIEPPQADQEHHIDLGRRGPFFIKIGLLRLAAKKATRFVDLAAELRGEEQPVARIHILKRLIPAKLKRRSKSPAILGQLPNELQHVRILDDSSDSHRRREVRCIDVIAIVGEQPVAARDEFQD